ncbi:hypothetical protein GGC64_006266 [Mycobacterium sp. OAS707]|uniref:lipoprotein LpqH n=1 Tax=Mycobacterium sp. OAS707 TaxID=2663822 RepID=UPI00178A07BC|nr:lipoprotein LpqH [Mycobacterium sp. OAS707]MBE1552179.1 hypothetical protein [Mycobacterium sp. OAS707]
MGIAIAHRPSHRRPGHTPERLRPRTQRLLVPLVAVLIAAGSGCSPHSTQLLQTHTIDVRINGQRTGDHLVKCQQVQWLWNIQTLKSDPGLTAQVQTGKTVVAKSVQIDNVAGFTGDFWEGTTGNAQASVDRRTFTIRGTAEGYYHNNPNDRSTATFEITTDC